MPNTIVPINIRYRNTSTAVKQVSKVAAKKRQEHRLGIIGLKLFKGDDSSFLR
jgi:hypothetical protein